MTASDPENSAGYNMHDDPVADVRQFIGKLAPKEGLEPAIEEGRAIAAIVEPLGLPAELLAAVQLYPLYRDDFLKLKSLNNSKLQALSRFILGLDQLNLFSLPDNWQPGEALAVQQS